MAPRDRPFPAALLPEDALVAALTATLERALAATAAASPRLPGGSEPASVFFSVTKPDIAVAAYVRRLAKYAQCSPAAFPSALVYMDRLAAAEPKLAASAYNLHRLLLTSLCLAAKFLDDRCFSNAHYARVGGIASVVEMNRLELHLLSLLDFRLFVSSAEYGAKEALLLAALAPAAPPPYRAPAHYVPRREVSPVAVNHEAQAAQAHLYRDAAHPPVFSAYHHHRAAHAHPPHAYYAPHHAPRPAPLHRSVTSFAISTVAALAAGAESQRTPFAPLTAAARQLLAARQTQSLSSIHTARAGAAFRPLADAPLPAFARPRPQRAVPAAVL